MTAVKKYPHRCVLLFCVLIFYSCYLDLFVTCLLICNGAVHCNSCPHQLKCLGYSLTIISWLCVICFILWCATLTCVMKSLNSALGFSPSVLRNLPLNLHSPNSPQKKLSTIHPWLKLLLYSFSTCVPSCGACLICQVHYLSTLHVHVILQCTLKRRQLLGINGAERV